MKASSIGGLFSHLLLIAIAFQIVSKSDALTPLETCQLVQDKSFIADPADCQGWYYCLSGEPIAGKCNSGLLYNSYTGSCDYPANVVCGANTTTMCTGFNKVFKPDPYNCEGYCYCTNGQTECTTCPDGQLFDISGPKCTYDAQANCVNGSPCLLVANSFIKNPDTCNGWYRCSKGLIASSGECGTGYLYDAFTGMCNYASQVECTVPVSSEAPAASTTPDAPANHATDCAEAKFIADGATCRGYFYCEPETDGSGGYNLHWGECPVGSQFSADDEACTNPYNASPPCPNGDRCDGSLMTYMAEKDTECVGYVVCSNNETASDVLPCPENYNYLDEKLGACVPTKPELAICGPE